MKEIEGSGSSRAWEDLNKDVLITIYQKMDLKDLIVGAPLCCTSWYKASKDPSVWRDIDFSLSIEYFLFTRRGMPIKYPCDYFLDNKHDEVTQLIEFVVNRSHGSMTSIKFFDFVDVDDLLLISQRCPGLEHFKIHMYYSNLPKLLFGKETVCVAISNLKELEGMDVQNEFIDETILEQIDEFCPNFTKLKIAGRVQENTATLISKSLPKLRVLDISGTRIGRLALLVILKGCKELEHLDVSRCSPDWGRYRPLSEVIDGDDEIRKSAYHLKVFKWK